MKTLIATTAFAAIEALAQPAAATKPANAGVYRFADSSRVPGAVSTLNSGAPGASFTLRTSGLPGGQTVTVSWVIFNEPQNCRHGELGLRCGPGDVRSSAATAMPTTADSWPQVTSSERCSGPSLVNPHGRHPLHRARPRGCSTRSSVPTATTASGPATNASTCSSHHTSNEGVLT